MFNDLVLLQPGFEPRSPHARRMFYLLSYGQFILNPPPAFFFITITGIFRNFTEKERSVGNNCNKYLYINNADTLTGVLDV